MSRDWESTFRTWSKPSSDTEAEKCANAVRMVRDAIRECDFLKRRNIDVFPQGSYRNNTNVRVDSDVDICVLCKDTYFYDLSLSGGLTPQDIGIIPSTYDYAQFKSDVEKALKAKFGERGVVRGNKAFDIHANSYRVDADIIACFEHRRYHRKSEGGFYSLFGTKFLSDKGGEVENWPQQHYENGLVKNKATGNRFKFITRAIKRLRYEREEKGFTAAKPIPSYLIECLIWNVPDGGFGHTDFAADVRYALAHVFNETMTDEKCGEWGEVNELKYLFGSAQPWTRVQAHAFADAAWNYIGFE